MKLKLAVSAFLALMVAGFFILNYYSGSLLKTPAPPSQSSEDLLSQNITVDNKEAVLTQVDATLSKGISQLDSDLRNVEAISKDDDPNTLQEQTLGDLKKRADNLIDVRIASLNRLLQRVQGEKLVPSGERTAFSTEVQANMTKLINLKAKIDADSNVNTVRAQAKSVISDFKIFAIFEPKINLLVAVDNLSAIAGKIFPVTGSFQQFTNTLKSQGKDTSKVQGLLDTINSDLSTINYKLEADKKILLDVSVASNSAVFVSIRKDLETVRSEFSLIKDVFTQMRQVLNSL